MLLTVEVHELLIASWPTDRESVARTLPSGLEPAEVDGRHLVSLAALRYRSGRVGRVPVPRFSQLNLRVYVSWADEPAVFFLASRVSLPGMGAILLGAPYRLARLHFRPGIVKATGLGVSIPYRRVGPGLPQALGAHELGLFEAAGLRGFRIRRGEALWEEAAPVGDVRADFLLAHGFELKGPPDLLYANQVIFEAELPPRKMSASRSAR